jgi:D-psicose/D-tagatose/L-ribulose 3-epimerase
MAIGIGVNSWVWTSPFTTESLGLLKKAASMGFDSFEFAVENPADFDVKKVKNAIAESGLRPVVCGAFGPSRDLTHEEAKFRTESLDYIRDTLKLCQAWGVKVMCGPMYSAVGKRRHVSPEQKKVEWDLAVKGLKQAGTMAADHGVVLAIEPLNRFETDLVNTAAQCVKLVCDVGHDAVRVHLDTFHMNIEEDSIYEAVKLAGKSLAHIHACECNRGTPGNGLVDWKGLAKGLKEINYSGEAVIESFTPECKAIAAAAAIWRPLAKTQDDLASNGLKFLKPLLNK